MATVIEAYAIRNYVDSDAGKIGEFGKVLELSYRYNPDFEPANIFCAVSPSGDVLAAGHLAPHDSWRPIVDHRDMPEGFIHRLSLDIAMNPAFDSPQGLRADLMRTLIARARELRLRYPGKRIRAFTWLQTDDNEAMDFHLGQGFSAYQSCLVMRRDLSVAVPDMPAPPGVTVEDSPMGTEEELKRYFDAETEAFSGVTWSLDMVRWLKGGPEWRCFSAFHGDELIGSAMTWMITDDRSATEDIFVVPRWQGRGVGRYVVTRALKHLQGQGKGMATLSVHGDNRGAIALYRSLGYHMYYMMVEFGLDL